MKCPHCHKSINAKPVVLHAPIPDNYESTGRLFDRLRPFCQHYGEDIFVTDKPEDVDCERCLKQIALLKRDMDRGAVHVIRTGSSRISYFEDGTSRIKYK